MRLALLFTLFCSLVFPQQTDIWQHVSVKAGSMQLKGVTLSAARLAAAKKALAARVRLDSWPCADGGEPDWVDQVTFEELPISTTEETVLAEAGAGCARGGQGSNGAMWVLRFQGSKLTFLATPEHDFSGWLYSIESTRSHGFQDLVLGWHMSAQEANLSYFRFDGTLYRRLGTAQLIFDDDYKGRIVPNPAP